MIKITKWVVSDIYQRVWRLYYLKKKNSTDNLKPSTAGIFGCFWYYHVETDA